MEEVGVSMSEIERLKTIVEKLRSEDGCPWDKAQTHESLKPGWQQRCWAGSIY